MILQDFIIKLLRLKDPITRQIYNIILVIVDKLIKQGYFIVYIEEIYIEDMARIYIKEVFIRHEVLIKIISDRDLRFVVAFQEVFLAEQGVRVVTSTIYYPQTDGWIKRLNQTLEQYLRHYINYAENNQVLLLLVIQFIYNIILQEGIQILLFQANYRYKPRILLLLR